MKRHRPSGAQQRKKSKARILELQSLSGSMLKFVNTSTSNVEDEVVTSPQTEESNENGQEVIEDIGEKTDANEEIEKLKVDENEDKNKLEDTIAGKDEEDISMPKYTTPLTLTLEKDAATLFHSQRKIIDNVLIDGTPENEEQFKENSHTRNEKSKENDVFEVNHKDRELEDEIEINKIENDDGERETNSNNLYSDISDWPLPVPDKLRVEFIKRGSGAFQNKDGPFVSLIRNGEKTKGANRHLTSDWFYISQPNGEKILRTWMIYSIKAQSLYCFCCRIFATNETLNNNPSKFVTGFQTWWKLNPKVQNHETSEQHETSVAEWKALQTNLFANKTIDHISQAVAQTERRKWRDLLKRLLDITMFLSKQNLPFRGHREHILAENKGNFLELVELLSKYDPILKEHLMKIGKSTEVQHPGKILTSYLSPTIQNEFIVLLGGIVRGKILRDIKKAKYFSIIFDSTPDISHIDQMSQIIRYVHIENKEVVVKESFLGFFQLTGKKAIDVTNEILRALERDD